MITLSSRVLQQPLWDAEKYRRVMFARGDHIVTITITYFLAAPIAALNAIDRREISLRAGN